MGSTPFPITVDKRADTSAADAIKVALPARQRKRSRKAVFLTWLRLTHLYLGLWGAVLGLLFGATGILLNHRAILRIPVTKVVPSSVQLPLPAGGIADPADLSLWLQAELKFTPTMAPQIKTQPAGKVIWNDQEWRSRNAGR